MLDRQSLLFLERIGKNELVETWLAQWPGSARRIVLKRSSASGGDALAEANSLLKSVFHRTRDIRHNNILNPTSMLSGNEPVSLLRDYIEDAEELTTDHLADSLPQVVYQLFSAVDFIHGLGLVHTDLRSSNFLVTRRGGACRVLLADLDFITPTATHAQGEITGTIGHIAPEVITERLLLPQSDFYSLGVMLSKLVQPGRAYDTSLSFAISQQLGRESTHLVSAKSVDARFAGLVPLINALLEPRYQERPLWLGSLIEQYAKTFGWDFEAYKRDVLWSLVRTSAARLSRDEGLRRSGLAEAVANDIDILGLDLELFRDIRKNWRSGSVTLMRLLREIIDSATIERSGYSWRVQVPERKVFGTYARFGLSPELSQAVAGRQPLNLRVKAALRLKLRKGHYKAFLILKSIVASPEFAQLPEKTRSAVHSKLGYLCLAIGRANEGRDYLRQALDYKKLHPWKAVQLICEVSSIHSQGKSPTQAREAALWAVRVARQSGDDRLRLKALNKLIWSRFMIRGGRRVAASAWKLFEYAERNGHDFASKPLANSFAAILWSQGKYREAVKFLTHFLESHRFLPSEEIQFSLYTNLGLALGDQSHFGAAIRAYKRALAVPPGDHNWGRQVFAHQGLVASYVASSDFQRALAEAENVYDKTRRWGDPAARMIYNSNLGQVYLAKGQIRTALRHLRLAEEAARVSGAGFYRSSAVMYLTRAERWGGDLVALRRDLETLRELITNSVDPRLKLHERLHTLWLEAAESGELDMDRARELLETAAEKSRALEYSEALFLMAEFGYGKEAFRLRSVSKAIWRICRKKRAPRYAGLYYLIRSLSGKADAEPRYRINQLKLAIDQLGRAEARYHAAVAALRLIREYKELGKFPRAQGVLNHARILAEPLDNGWLNAQIEAETAQLREMIGPEGSNIDLLREVGDILTSVHNYRKTLEMLLRQAVNLTGSERGAIVLTHSDVSALKIEVSHACDEVSERDILTISHSTIKRTLEERQGLIIHDAQRDELTREFRSVKIHSIVSIACVPLMTRGKLLGALYLDHRSLPALYGKENYRVIEALAQFMAVAIDMARGIRKSSAERTHAVEKLDSMGASVGFLAVDSKSRGVLSQLPKVAAFDTHVLLRGESGTGKGLLAEAIHNQSRRSDGPFISLNCSHLQGSNGLAELFGVAQSAFTGVGAREGRIERADGGTLFLDEIAELPPEMQAALLDVLDSKKITRTGCTTPINVDFRLICATNADLVKLAERKKFREDLFFRISAFVINVPPLRQRPGDIEPLVRHLISILPGGGPSLSYTSRFINALQNYQWPGNVRELRNEIERVLILRDGNRLDIDLLKPDIARHHDGDIGAVSLDEFLLRAEREHITAALKRTRGNVTAAGRILKSAPSTLRSKLTKLKIQVDDFKPN